MSGSDGVFNIAKGYVTYYSSLPAASDALIVVLLKVVEADDTLNNYDTLSALLAGSNTEANATNYARKSITSVSTTVDDTNNWVTIDFADQTWSTLGGGTNNTLVKLLVCYDGDTGAGTDANIVPLTYHTFDVTTDGSDVTATVANFYKAS